MMEQRQAQGEYRDFWDNLRDTVRGGFTDLRNKGDELARQGRIRMEIYQLERRLREIYTLLGQESVELLEKSEAVNLENPRIRDAANRVKYLKDEIQHLRDELAKKPEAENIS